MNGAGAQWWSSSKKRWELVSAMPLPYARNALAKLERGEARHEDGGPYWSESVAGLREALEQRILDLEAEAAANAQLNAESQAEGL